MVPIAEAVRVVSGGAAYSESVVLLQDPLWLWWRHSPLLLSLEERPGSERLPPAQAQAHLLRGPFSGLWQPLAPGSPSNTCFLLGPSPCTEAAKTGCSLPQLPGSSGQRRCRPHLLHELPPHRHWLLQWPQSGHSSLSMPQPSHRHRQPRGSL